MDVWEVVRLILSIAAALVTALLAVIAYQYRDKMQAVEKAVAVEKKAIEQERIERRVEYASVRSKMEVLSDEREAGDYKTNDRINNLEVRLPNEYARQGTVDALERRLDNIQAEMREGFRHQDAMLKEITRMIKNGN